jgi:hypothetical protein
VCYRVIFSKKQYNSFFILAQAGTHNKNKMDKTFLPSFLKYNKEENYSTIREHPLIEELSDEIIPLTTTTTTTTNTEEIKTSIMPQSFEDEILAFIKSNPPIKLIILTPCYGGVNYVNYTICLLNTFQTFQKLGIKLHVEFCKNDSLVSRARNNLIAKAMTDEEMTHILFIDNDITWDTKDILKLLMSDKKLIGGIYPLKKYNWDKLLNKSNVPLQQIINSKKESNDWLGQVDNVNFIKSTLLNYNLNPYSNEIEINNNIAKIRHLPTGFMMIQRDVIEKMSFMYSETKYSDDIGFLTEKENKWAYALFDCGVFDNHYLSEDWLFCERWKKINGEIYTDITIILTHTGIEDYTGSILLSL